MTTWAGGGMQELTEAGQELAKTRQEYEAQLEKERKQVRACDFWPHCAA